MSNADNRGRNIRLLILFGVLALMLAALWYDRAVARPGVDAAYEAIAKLNDKINTTGGNKVMTNQDVQNELKRKPSRVRTEGPYEIEVYSWMAGLPFRTHDYYAVYTKDGETRVFKTHYKIKLPLNELVPPPVTVGAQGGAGGAPPEEAEAFAGPLPGSAPPAGAEDTPKGKGKRKRAKAGPPEEVKAEAKEEPLGKEEPAKAPDASVPPPPKSEKAGAAPAEAPAGAGAAKEKQEQPAPPPEKKDEKTNEKKGAE